METIDQLLDGRRISTPWYRTPAIFFALLLHVGLAAAAIVGPMLLREEHRKLEFVSIQVVPQATFGQTRPQPATPRRETPQRTEAPAAEPPAATSRTLKVDSGPKDKPAVVAPAEPSRDPAPSAPAEPRETVAEAAPPAIDQPSSRLGSPLGNPLSSAGPASVSAFDDPNFTYSYYTDQLLSRIRTEWRRPEIGGDIELAVYFRIQSDGSVTDAKIVDSSGYNSFDRAGLQAVVDATLPPLPRSYRRDSLGVRLIFH